VVDTVGDIMVHQAVEVIEEVMEEVMGEDTKLS
jgi:hypothetical protein